jgi:DNA-directed RNA polymerase subunit RPC12/RpoP/GNAT superfamily N-acetyltransferase
MPYQAVSVSGWKSRKLTTISMYRCPECGHTQDMICGGGEGKYQCFGCGKHFSENEFGEVKRERTAVACANCGRNVTLLPSTFGIAGLGFICSDCHNYVAVLYGTHFVNPRTVLTFGWNPAVCRRAQRMPSGLSFLVCETMKDFLVLKVLQAIVKEEDERFLFGRPKEHEAGLLLDCRRRKYLGFLVWTERTWEDGVWVDSEHAVLRQIFIVEDERRKGLAQQMVTHWVEQHADKLNSKFGIEAPNEKATALHLKLGHIKAEGDSYVGVKCFRVQSF